MTDNDQHLRPDSADHRRAERPAHRADQQPSKEDQANSDDRDDGNKPQDDQPKEDGPPFYKRPWFLIAAGIVIIVVIVGGLLWWLHARQFESTDDAFIDAHIVRLAPQVSGRLVWVAPSDNRHVRAGQLLAVIEPSGPETRLQQAQAGVAEADAAIAEAQGQVVAARAQQAQAVASARAPAAEAAKAARDYARYLKLVAIDPAAAAATQVDQARARAESMAAQAAAARRHIADAHARLIVAEKGVVAARARRRSAKARVAQANVTVGDLRIVAPVDGQVVNRTVNVGSTVSPQSQMMAIVPDRIWVTANFKETQLAQIRPGQHVDIKVDAFPDASFSGHVDSIQRGAGQAFGILPPQNASGNFVKVVQRVPVRILFDRMPDPRRWPIGPGMSVVPSVRVR